MAQIIDFFEAKDRLRPAVAPEPSYLVVEVPSDVAKALDSTGQPDLLVVLDYILYGKQGPRH